VALTDTDPSAVPRAGSLVQGERKAIIATLERICPLLATPGAAVQAPRPLLARLSDVIQLVVPEEARREYLRTFLEQMVDEADASNLSELLQVVSSTEAAGFAYVGMSPYGFVTLAPKVMPNLNLKHDAERLLKCFGGVGAGSQVSAEEMERTSEVPIPRANMIVQYLAERQLVAISGPGRSSESLGFFWCRLLPAGERVIKGFEALPI